MDKKVIGGKKKIFSRFFIIISLSQYRDNYLSIDIHPFIYLSIYIKAATVDIFVLDDEGNNVKGIKSGAAATLVLNHLALHPTRDTLSPIFLLFTATFFQKIIVLFV